jgi:hypothetical protein
MDWILLANVGTTLAGFSVVFVVIQLAKDTKSQNVQSFFYLHSFLTQSHFNAARKKVRTELYAKPYQEWDKDSDCDAANSVCQCYTEAGVLINSGAIDKKTILMFYNSYWGDSIIHQYEVLSPFLDDSQTPELTGREFFSHFTWLYDEVKKNREHVLKKS